VKPSRNSRCIYVSMVKRNIMGLNYITSQSPYYNNHIYRNNHNWSKIY